MTLTRRFILFILLISLTLSLAACSAKDIPAPSVTLDSAVTEDIPIPEPEPEFVFTGYTGTMNGYEYRYESGRDREWEEDILYLAQHCLDHHPRLTEKCWLYGDATGYTLEYFDADLRAEFIHDTDELILSLPDLDEDAIKFELSRIANLLGDGHTRFFFSGGSWYFPLFFKILYDGETPGVYTVAVPKDQPDIIFARLSAINGVSVDEIIEDLLPYTYGDNDYWKRYIIVEANRFLVKRDMLALIGVMDADDEEAEFSFVTDGGEDVNVTLPVLTGSESRKNLLNKTFAAIGNLMSKNSDLDYWQEYLADDNIEYIRYNHCFEREDLSYSDFWYEIMMNIRGADTPPKVIFDLRGNGGGYFPPQGIGGFIASLKLVDISGLYVLIDQGVFSSAAAITAMLKLDIEGTVTVGTPAGQSANLFGPANSFKFPNHKDLGFDMSDRQFVWWEGYEEYTIMPDITVYQTLDDYKNGVDTVLEAVKSYE